MSGEKEEQKKLVSDLEFVSSSDDEYADEEEEEEDDDDDEADEVEGELVDQDEEKFEKACKTFADVVCESREVQEGISNLSSAMVSAGTPQLFQLGTLFTDLECYVPSLTEAVREMARMFFEDVVEGVEKF